MATNKNQHFVPRCYLRRFTQGDADRAINLYNVDRDTFVKCAPVKNQCSGDYFYGKDPNLEQAIQVVERSYAAVVGEVLLPSYALTGEHRELLGLFWLLQHLRTDAASRRVVQMGNDLASALDAGGPFRMQVKHAVQDAMLTFAEHIDVVADLRACLVRNHSRMPFVTSDDPAVLTNRWHLHNARRTGRTFGLRSAGALLFLPLSPKVMFVAYDGDVHSFPHSKGWVDLHDCDDADAFNQHQYINCRANIFVRDQEHFDAVRAAYSRAASRRLLERHRLTHAVLDSTYGGYSRYVVVDREQAKLSSKAIIHTEMLHATPLAWPKQLKWRSGACVYSNGTGVGYVRRAFTDLRQPPFRKRPAFLL